MNRSLSLCLCATLFALVLGRAPSTAAAADDKPIKCLLILGGCCHDYANQKDILTRGISRRTNIEFTVAYDPDKTTKHENPIYAKEDWYKGFDVVIHDECTADVTDLDFINRILEPHKKGLPAVNLHCAMHCYRSAPYKKTTPWMEFTGMNTNHHNEQRPIDVKFIDQSNPIVAGMEDWTTVNEELYHPEELLSTAHALANGHQNSRVENETDAAVVWTNDYHGAKVFSTTLGHNNKTVGDPRYLDLVTRGLLWSVGKLDDQHFKKVPAATASEKK
jgi:type 1 glutamine amidotransferase